MERLQALREIYQVMAFGLETAHGQGGGGHPSGKQSAEIGIDKIFRIGKGKHDRIASLQTMCYQKGCPVVCLLESLGISAGGRHLAALEETSEEQIWVEFSVVNQQFRKRPPLF